MSASTISSQFEPCVFKTQEASPSAGGEDIWDSKVLEALFEKCFLQKYATKLLGGVDEPLYQPARHKNEFHQIFYRFDYFSSALHEVAHWCIAGKQRRQQDDYGYWYEPDGRDREQQLAFQKVEVKPQAIEMAFSIACNKPFSVSIDNLDANQTDSENSAKSDELLFSRAVTRQYQYYYENGFPVRAQQFIMALEANFKADKGVSYD